MSFFLKILSHPRPPDPEYDEAVASLTSYKIDSRRYRSCLVHLTRSLHELAAACATCSRHVDNWIIPGAKMDYFWVARGVADFGSRMESVTRTLTNHFDPTFLGPLAEYEDAVAELCRKKRALKPVQDKKPKQKDIERFRKQQEDAQRQYEADLRGFIESVNAFRDERRLRLGVPFRHLAAVFCKYIREIVPSQHFIDLVEAIASPNNPFHRALPAPVPRSPDPPLSPADIPQPPPPREGSDEDQLPQLPLIGSDSRNDQPPGPAPTAPAAASTSSSSTSSSDEEFPAPSLPSRDDWRLAPALNVQDSGDSSDEQPSVGAQDWGPGLSRVEVPEQSVPRMSVAITTGHGSDDVQSQFFTLPLALKSRPTSEAGNAIPPPTEPPTKFTAWPAQPSRHEPDEAPVPSGQQQSGPAAWLLGSGTETVDLMDSFRVDAQRNPPPTAAGGQTPESGTVSYALNVSAEPRGEARNLAPCDIMDQPQALGNQRPPSVAIGDASVSAPDRLDLPRPTPAFVLSAPPLITGLPSPPPAWDMPSPPRGVDLSIPAPAVNLSLPAPDAGLSALLPRASVPSPPVRCPPNLLPIPDAADQRPPLIPPTPPPVLDAPEDHAEHHWKGGTFWLGGSSATSVDVPVIDTPDEPLRPPPGLQGATQMAFWQSGSSSPFPALPRATPAFEAPEEAYGSPPAFTGHRPALKTSSDDEGPDEGQRILAPLPPLGSEQPPLVPIRHWPGDFPSGRQSSSSDDERQPMWTLPPSVGDGSPLSEAVDHPVDVALPPPPPAVGQEEEGEDEKDRTVMPPPPPPAVGQEEEEEDEKDRAVAPPPLPPPRARSPSSSSSSSPWTSDDDEGSHPPPPAHTNEGPANKEEAEEDDDDSDGVELPGAPPTGGDYRSQSSSFSSAVPFGFSFEARGPRTAPHSAAPDFANPFGDVNDDWSLG